jgi:hypothetical protein
MLGYREHSLGFLLPTLERVREASQSTTFSFFHPGMPVHGRDLKRAVEKLDDSHRAAERFHWGVRLLYLFRFCIF